MIIQPIRACLIVNLFPMLLAGCAYAHSDKEQADTTTRLDSGLKVEIVPGTGFYAVRGQYSVIVRFHNTGTQSIGILKPLDGSLVGLHMPNYRFAVTDQNGQVLKPRRDCGTWNSGLWSNTQWPKDYLVEIKPGASFDEEQPVPVAKDGPYMIGFEYIYEPMDELHPPPQNAWRGRMKAPIVALNMKLE